MATASTHEHVVLVDHLVDLVERQLVTPLELIVASVTPLTDLRAGLRIEAEVWAAQLLGRDRSLAISTVHRLLAALYPSDRPFEAPPGWWQSPLGEVVARRIGHPSAQRVSAAEAGNMLGITRQGVHDLLTRNKLHRHPDGGRQHGVGPRASGNALVMATTDYGGHGDLVVLLHGAGGTADDWATLAPLLAEQHHVVGVDLPGHGRSPAPSRPWSFADALDEIARLDLGNPAVVGMSLGGMLAVHWGHRHPECPAVVSLDGHRAPLTAHANYPGFPPGELDTARGELRAVFAAMAAAAPTARPDIFTGVFNAMQADDTVPLLATMPCPTLLAVATRSLPGAEAFDELMAAFRRGLDRDLHLAAQANPNLTTTHLAASHAMVVEIPGQLATLILDHLT